MSVFMKKLSGPAALMVFAVLAAGILSSCSGGGGGGGPTTYSVMQDLSVTNGRLDFSHGAAAEGTTVTITVTPDKNCTFMNGSLTVTKTGGSDMVAVSQTGGGTWTFTMPAFGVTVSAGFEVDEQFFTFTIKTAAADEQFTIPVQGGYTGSYNFYTRSYNWNIDWGDGSAIEAANGLSGENAAGIGHSYAAAGRYSITIKPKGSKDAWFWAFGFKQSGASGANSQDNKNRVVSVDSPLQPLMTRTQAQINSNTAPIYEWAYTFYGCTNLTMGEDFCFSAAWDSITKVDDYFAYAMFCDCSGAGFTMNDIFNLPQGITTAGEYFAAWMFTTCSGNKFKMNDVFNLPQGIAAASENFARAMFKNCSGPNFKMNDVFTMPQHITTAGEYFAYEMFYGCSGGAFTMGSAFNLPQGIATTNLYFAASMFNGCSGAQFKMNDVFTMPQSIITAGHSFAHQMFYGCSGNVFTMGSAFNLPQGITTASEYFAYGMFQGCSGNKFKMNGVFNLPQGITAADRYFAVGMFSGTGGNFWINTVFVFPASSSSWSNSFSGTFALSIYGLSTRTATSIINGNAAPGDDRNTFGPKEAWSDYTTIHANWRL